MMQKKDDVSNLHVLAGGSLPRPEAPQKELLEAFPNRFSQRPYIVEIVFPEFTSLCPVTGQPDFGEIHVEYIPDKLCVESKSFKLYMFAFRNHPAFMESITNTILDDLLAALSPFWCQVKGIFVPRGGTAIHVFAEEYKKAACEAQIRQVVADWRQTRRP